MDITTSRQRRGTLWALTATHSANDFYTGAVTALLPFLMLYADYSYAEVAGIALAATALSSVAQPVFGYLSDRFGLSWLSMAGLLTAGAGIALSGLAAGSYAALWTTVAISGIGVAAYHPAATAEARRLGGGTTASMSLFSVGGNLGVALAPAAVVATVGRWGLSASTLLIGPAVVLGGVYAMAASRNRPPVPVAETPVVPLPVDHPEGPRIADDWVAFGRLTAVLATWSVAYVGTSTFIALYCIERFGASTGFGAVALSVFPAAGAIGTLSGGCLADRIGRLAIVRSGYVLAGCAVLAIVFAPSAESAVVATGVLGVSLFLPFAAQITLSHAYLPNRIGLASGVTLGLTLSLGGLVSPLLGGIADSSGVRMVFVIVAVLIAAGFALSFSLAERTESDVQPGPDDEVDAVAESRVETLTRAETLTRVETLKGGGRG